jgi:COP9 signalosome complex subunit 4
MEAKLAAIAQKDGKEHRNLIVSLVEEICSPVTSGESVKQLISALLVCNISQSVIKAGLVSLADCLKTSPPDVTYELGSFLLQEFRNVSYSCDEAEFTVRESIFEYLVACQQFTDAAEVLALINIESSSVVMTAIQKANNLVKIAECYLMEKEYVEADIFASKAGVYMNEVDQGSDIHLQLRYRVVMAQILDANRKFVDAALRYHELSNIQSTQVSTVSVV